MHTPALIIAPYETEKTVRLARKDVYTFWVENHATKPGIQSAFEQIYGVKPVAVRLLSSQDKRRSNTGTLKRRAQKKALITLKKGTKIDLAKLS